MVSSSIEIRDFRLVRLLAVTYTLLTLYACLYPLKDWTDSGVGVLDFLFMPWPRYFTWLDISLNILGFMPLGFLIAAAIDTRRSPISRTIMACWSCVGISLCVEFIQNFLPSRVASNLDVIANSSGAIIGALLALRWANIFDYGASFQQWIETRMQPGLAGEIGIVLIGLWWLCQFDPTNLLFSNGDLRAFIALPALIAFSANRHVMLESCIVACQVFAMGFISWRMMRSPSLIRSAAVILLGLAIKTFATRFFLQNAGMFMWATMGALQGLLGGVALLLALRYAPSWLQSALACSALVVAIVLVNIAPPNPYLNTPVHLLAQGHLINFNGVTRVVAGIWPFLALVYLTLAIPRSR